MSNKGILDFEDVVSDEEFDEGDEGDEGNDYLQEAANASGSGEMMGKMIRDIMEEKGPIVSVIIIEPNGKMVEETVDMSPRGNQTNAMLGGSPTFVGQWEENEDDEFGDVIVILKKRDPVGTDVINKHKLPFPFHEECNQGRLILIRMNGEAIPQNLTKKDYLMLALEQRKLQKEVERVQALIDAEEAAAAANGGKALMDDDCEDDEEMPELV